MKWLLARLFGRRCAVPFCIMPAVQDVEGTWCREHIKRWAKDTMNGGCE